MSDLLAAAIRRADPSWTAQAVNVQAVAVALTDDAIISHAADVLRADGWLGDDVKEKATYIALTVLQSVGGGSQ